MGEREIKYLMLIPMNGDPIEFIPEVEQVYAEGQAIEIQLPHVASTQEKFRVSNQSTLKHEPRQGDVFQILVDIYTKEPIIAILGIYIAASR